jgi:adiponectin receptor
MKPNLVDCSQVPAAFQEPFIVSGYRATGQLSAKQCIWSLFQWHNETANVWSHVLTTFVYIFWMLYLQVGTVNFIDDVFALPLLAMTLGYIMCSALSSLAHLFNCMSQDIRDVCFYADYAGVTMAGLSSLIGNLYYSRLEDVLHSDWPLPHVMNIQVVICAVACYISCATRQGVWSKKKELCRVMSFAMPYLISNIPVVLRMWYAKQWNDVLYGHLIRIILTVVGSTMYAVHVPERLIPSLFDYIGHSHCMMHILLSIGSFVHIYSCITDMTTLPFVSRGITSYGQVFRPIVELLLAQGIIFGHFAYQLFKHKLNRLQDKDRK